MGKKEILLLATTWMNLEGLVLSEMSDGQTLYDKKAKLWGNRKQSDWLPGAGDG